MDMPMDDHLCSCEVMPRFTFVVRPEAVTVHLIAAHSAIRWTSSSRLDGAGMVSGVSYRWPLWLPTLLLVPRARSDQDRSPRQRNLQRRGAQGILDGAGKGARRYEG